MEQNILETEFCGNSMHTLRSRCENPGMLDRKRKARKRNRDSVFLFDRLHSPHKSSRRWSIVHESRGRRQINPQQRLETNSSSGFYDCKEKGSSNRTCGIKSKNDSMTSKSYNTFLRRLHHDRMNREQSRNADDVEVMGVDDVPMRSRTPEPNRFLRALHQEKLCRNSPQGSSLIVPSFVLRMSPNHHSSSFRQQGKRDSFVPTTQHRCGASTCSSDSKNISNSSNSIRSTSSGSNDRNSRSCCSSSSSSSSGSSTTTVGNPSERVNIPIKIMGKCEQKEDIRPRQLSFDCFEKEERASKDAESLVSLPSFQWFSMGCGKRNRNEMESTNIEFHIASSGKRMRLLPLQG
eukprot:jgi/Bigna1/88874/estExt_fgenesh1_pg.C_390130